MSAEPSAHCAAQPPRLLYANRVIVTGSTHAAATTPRARAVSWMRLGRILASVAFAFVAYWSLVRGLITGTPAIAIVILAVVLIRSARSLSGRIAINGSLALTIPPVLAALPMPAPINPGALLVAGAVGGLTLSVSWNRFVLPNAAVIDSLPLATVVISAIGVKDFLSVHGPRQALGRLLPGYDYSAHFDMFEMLRQHAATVASRGSGGPGGSWAFWGYPRGYHAACAMIADLVGQPSGRIDDLAAFAVANGLLVVCASTCLVAGVCSLGKLRVSPAYAAFAVFMVLCVVLLGIGSRPITNGFVNFWLAAVLSSLALLLSMDVEAPWLVRNVVVQCLVVATAFAWMPLVMLAIPALLSDVRRQRARLGSIIRFSLWAPSLAICLVPLEEIVVGNGSNLRAVVYANGGFLQSRSYLAASSLIVALSIASTLVADRRREGVGKRFLPRGPQLVLVPLLGLTMACGLATLQLATIHHLTYYFFKIVGGIDIVLTVVTVATLAMLAADSRVQRQPSTSRPMVLTAAAALFGLAVLFGGFGDTLGPDAVVPNTTVLTNAKSVPPIARNLIEAAKWTSSDQFGRRKVLYAPMGRGAGPNKRGDRAWLMALTGTYTKSGSALNARIGDYSSLENAALAVERAQPSLRYITILTQPAWAADLRAGLRSAGVTARVRSW